MENILYQESFKDYKITAIVSVYYKIFGILFANVGTFLFILNWFFLKWNNFFFFWNHATYMPILLILYVKYNEMYIEFVRKLS